jgi:acyl dehydratase
MAFNFETAMAAADHDLPYAYSDTQIMLYALAIGMGRDALDPQEIDFVYEKHLKIIPTVATVLALGARDIRKLGVDYSKVLHGEQKLTLHRPLPARGEMLVSAKTKAVYDKGKDKGALIVSVIDAFEKTTRAPLFSQETSHFARADGGFSHMGGDSGEAPAPHTMPSRKPDLECEVATTSNQALLYRLLGDRNVLHVDVEAARTSGFDRPILHGLCTYGVCCYAIVKTICDYDPSRIAQFDVRFSAPVFPGETLIVSIWRDANVISFRASTKERNVVVINNGHCLLHATSDTGARARS